MDIYISDESKTIALDISDVPCNSIGKLADTLLNLQSGQKNSDVEFSLEPGYALWRFSISDDSINVEVYPDSKCKDPVIFIGNKEKTLHTLHQALRKLEASLSWNDSKLLSSTWSWDFPSKALDVFEANSKQHNKV